MQLSKPCGDLKTSFQHCILDARTRSQKAPLLQVRTAGHQDDTDKSDKAQALIAYTKQPHNTEFLMNVLDMRRIDIVIIPDKLKKPVTVMSKRLSTPSLLDRSSDLIQFGCVAREKETKVLILHFVKVPLNILAPGSCGNT